MPHLVTELELNPTELLSVVDRGAAGTDECRPRIVLIKRSGAAKEGSETMPDAIAKQLTAEEAQAKLESLREALSEEQMATVMMLVETAAAPSSPDTPEVTPKADDEPAKEDEAEKQEGEPAKEDEADKQEDDKEKDDMSKRAKEDIAKAQADAASARSELTKLRTEREIERLEKRCVDEFSGVPGMTHKRLAQVLKSCHDVLPSDEVADLEKSLKVTSEAILKGDLLKSLGRGGENDQSAWGQITALAKKRQEIEPGISISQARSRVMGEQPELFRAAQRENSES